MVKTLIGIIDLGTNTFNLLIGEKGNNGSIIHTEKRLVKLAEGSHNLDYIRNEPYRRALSAIKEYAYTLEKLKVEHVFAYATSGLRSAGNGDQFILDCWMNYKINIQLIKGIKEAELISIGVLGSFSEPVKSALLIDIGGGSTEFCIIQNGKNIWSNSYKLGASRLKENFNLQDPLSPDDIKSLSSLFEKELLEVFELCRNYNISQLIGSSGSFDTLVDILALEKSIELEHTNYKFELVDFQRLHKLMLSNDIKFRLQIPGMIPLRAELMPIATLLTNFILEKTGIEHLSMSKYSLKEGAYLYHR